MKEYDYENALSLLHDFYSLTGIKIGLFDKQEHELCFFPEKYTTFCSLLREDPEMEQKCRECDKFAFSQCKKTHKQFSYTCHAGLYECFSPILFEENIIGYVSIGQIKPPTQNCIDALEKLKGRENYAELKKAYSDLPDIPIEKIRSAIRILDACAGYQYIKNTIYQEENKVDILIENYINEHLNGDLSVSFLCSHFHMSHCEMYSVFRQHFNSTPAEYVKSRRLYKAFDLVKTTDLPIAEIAKSVGIFDYNYFSKVFKKAFRLSPTEIRKQMIREN